MSTRNRPSIISSVAWAYLRILSSDRIPLSSCSGAPERRLWLCIAEAPCLWMMPFRPRDRRHECSRAQSITGQRPWPSRERGLPLDGPLVTVARRCRLVHSGIAASRVAGREARGQMRCASRRRRLQATEAPVAWTSRCALGSRGISRRGAAYRPSCAADCHSPRTRNVLTTRFSAGGCLARNASSAAASAKR